MEYKKTAFHCEAGVATITMDCPENLNAIDVDMAKELLERLYQCDRSSEVKVVVLKGGVRAFSAGGDIRYLYDNIQRGVVESSELVVLVGKLALAMKQLNKLVICAVSGSAAGAGANLALSGDFVVCSENARFIQAFVGIALVPDTGGPYLLSRSIGAQRALEMCITGRPVPAEEALRLAGPNTVVVVVDTNRPEQTQAPDLLTSGARIVVIDHHRRAASYIEKPALSFHDPYASSASELVAELVQYILDSGDLKRVEAESILAGIVLDTKGFTMRTGSRTFETAAFLRKAGADISQVNKCFQHNLRDTVTKFQIIQGAQPYHGTMAITLTDRLVGRAIAGQAADEMLNIAGIEASFVLFPEAGQAYLSARSSGNVNVQVICETLGGGGNAATAGAQFPGKTPEEVLPLLKGAIDAYFDDGSDA